MNISKTHITSWLRELAVVYSESRDLLTKLDAQIGDADHGLNMNRGFDKVVEKLPTFEEKCFGTVLKSTGMTLFSSVGGASGPLYGTLFLKMAPALMGKEEATLEEFVVALEGGIAGLVSRGRAAAGDKTMCDVWNPTLSAMQSAIEQGNTMQEVLDLAVQTAEEATQATIPMQARKGRASYLGERSIGLQDPGATSSMLMIKALKKTIES